MTSIKNEQLLCAIIAPHVTEKTMKLSENNIHVFKVQMSATKPQISKACEFIYGAQPTSVKTMTYKPVAKRNMRGFKTEKRYKKAVVRFLESVTIDINKKVSEE